MIDETTIDKLSMLHETLQPFIDEVAAKRKAAISDKYLWNYVNKKIDLAGKAIGMALDKIEETQTADDRLKQLDEMKTTTFNKNPPWSS